MDSTFSNISYTARDGARSQMQLPGSQQEQTVPCWKCKPVPARELQLSTPGVLLTLEKRQQGNQHDPSPWTR